MTTSRLVFASTFLALAACGGGESTPDGGHSGSESCQRIIGACHEVDPGTGPIHECHETAHDVGTDEACAPLEADCVAMCEAAAADGGTVDGGHHEDAGLSDGGSDAAFAIRFRARVGDQAAACGTTYGGFGPGGAQEIGLKDFRFYVHGIELLRSDGSAVPLAIDDEAPWQREGVALLDFEDRSGSCAEGTVETRDVVNGHAPAGAYTGVRFVLGVPFDQNHQDVSAAQAPLNLSSLFWNWQGGYKFARIDSVVDPATPGPTFNVHLGSTGCDGTPTGGVTACTSPNRPTITLDGFDPATEVIVADYAALVEGLDLAMNTEGSAPGCMSGPTDPECTEVLTSLGVEHGGAAAAPDFFSVGTP